MTTEIPTYEIGAIAGIGYRLKMNDNATPIPIIVSADITNTEKYSYTDGTKMRLYADPTYSDGHPSLMYGPGSVTYEVIGVTTDNENHTGAAIPIDPKTYVDNYGYIHIGASNKPTDTTGATWIVIKIKPTYHYINPSTGDNVAISPADNATINIGLLADPGDINTVNADRMRSIPYNYSPSDGLGTM